MATHGEASKMIGADEDEAVGRDGGSSGGRK